MAEEDVEIALLHQMQMAQENGGWAVGGGDEAAEVEPSITEHNIESSKTENVADDQVLRALSPSGPDVSDDGDYDPSSVTPYSAVTLAVQEESRSSSRSSNRKPKTAGGFVADDSDDSEDEGSASGQASATTALQVPAAATSNRTVSPSPLQNSVTQEDLKNISVDQVDQDQDMEAQSSDSLPAKPSGVEQAPVPTQSTQVLNTVAAPAQAKARLPHDTTGILEDRIKEDPRGDLDAWMSLIAEHRGRHKFVEARATYERFLALFPHAAGFWVAYIEMELENDNFTDAEKLFGRCLLSVPNIQLWSVYLNYIRRRNDLTSDTSGTARATVSQSYDFVLSTIGIDVDSGRLWQEYIQFVRSGPGQIGGTQWSDQQKGDQVRKAYQRATAVPMGSVTLLWKEYDTFENSLNKQNGRKFLQDRSPAYMSARSATTALENITRGLVRTTLPKLPPVPGYEGDKEYQLQVELWKKWIAWEQEDQLALKTDEPEEYKKRVLYVFKQAIMPLRFWPEIWLDAAEWCFANGIEKEGETFLNDGITANPESCLLAFKKADRLETTIITDDTTEKGAAVRAPLDNLLNSLYGLLSQLKERENREHAKLEESLALDASISAIISKAEEDEEEDLAEKEIREAAKAVKTKAIVASFAAETRFLSRTISFAWIALMRAMRRVQGKGTVKSDVGGSRQIFADARTRGKITSDVYVASALIEHHVYKDPAGTKIFERGAKLFPDDEEFILEYLKHLLSTGDTTNARVAFETAVNRLTQKGPEFLAKTKPLYAYFHKYESQYGELAQIAKLEQRMAEIFPEDPKLDRFASRYAAEGFNPTATRPVVSPNTQMKAKSLMQSIEMPNNTQMESPRPQYAQQQEPSPRPQVQQPFLQSTNSPKRPFPTDDYDSEMNRPRKLARGESPLKGAAGRRLNQQKQQQQGGPSWQSNAPPFVVPRDLTFLLSIIPRSEFYTSTKFSSDALVRLLARTNVPDHNTWKSTIEQPQQQQAAPPQPPPAIHYNQQHYPAYTQPPPQILPPRTSAMPSYSQGQGNWSAAGSNDWAPDARNVNPPAVQPYGAYGADSNAAWQQSHPHSGQAQVYPPNSYAAPGVPAEAPYLQPASNWYYDAANAPPGYNAYGR